MAPSDAPTPPPAATPAESAATGPRLSPPAADAAPLPGAPAPGATAPATAPDAASSGTESGPAASLPHDLSPLGMFMAADIVVKAVMLGLAFASVVTWTIWLAKALELAMARRRAGRALQRLERAQGLGEITGGDRDSGWPRRGPVAALAAAAALEIARSQHLPADGVKERVQIALQRIEARAGRSMSRGTGLLATIGSTAPFVGLFGTVWGIMNAFIGISRANTTNLAVVAPGIAEALLATAIGLVAAIPAVIIYNVFARSIAGYRAVLADASAEVLRHLSRDLDRRERFVAGERRQAAE
jgi:biopolymer transport protein ExbB